MKKKREVRGGKVQIRSGLEFMSKRGKQRISAGGKGGEGKGGEGRGREELTCKGTHHF